MHKFRVFLYFALIAGYLSTLHANDVLYLKYCIFTLSFMNCINKWLRKNSTLIIIPFYYSNFLSNLYYYLCDRIYDNNCNIHVGFNKVVS